MVHLAQGGEKNFGWDSSESLHDFQESFPFTLCILTVCDWNLPGSISVLSRAFWSSPGYGFSKGVSSHKALRSEFEFHDCGKAVQPLSIFAFRLQSETSVCTISVAPTRIAVQHRQHRPRAHSCALRGFGRFDLLAVCCGLQLLEAFATSQPHQDSLSRHDPLPWNASPCSSCTPESVKIPWQPLSLPISLRT